MGGNQAAPVEHLDDQTDHYDPDRDLQDKLRVALILAAILALLLAPAAAFIPIGGAVIGQGKVGVESRVKKISHPGGGTIAEILVENGQHVRQGQVLIRLDDTVSGTDAELTALSVDQLLAQKARFEAELTNAVRISFPEALAARTDETARKAIAEEEKMFAIRRSEAAGIVSQLKLRIDQYEEEIAGYRTQIASLRQQRALIEPEREGLAKLYEKQLVTLNRLNQLERTAVDLEGSIGALNARIAQVRARISETREQIIQVGQTRRAEAGTQLAAIGHQLNQQQVQRVSAIDMHDRTVIRAPCDGVVENLAVSTIGGVIRPAEDIMTIVPDQDQLIVEAAVSPADVDQVQTGQRARIRLSALSASSSPELEGHVVYVGADSITDSSGEHRYVPVRVELDKKEITQVPDVQLRLAIPVEVFIQTRSRSMLSFLTKPLQDQFARAFRQM